jgi:uncharacterized membrane protein
VTTDGTPLSRGRIVAARTLTVVGLVLALVSLLAVFVRYELLDDASFRETSTELLQSEAIQQEIASTAVEALYANVDVAAQIREQLPEDQQGLAAPVAAALRGLANRIAVEAIGRPRVQTVLVTALDVSHSRLVRLLEDEGELTDVEDGVVYLDLRPLAVDLADRLGLPEAVADQLPPTAARIRLIESGEVETAQTAVRWLERLAAWTWVLVLAAWALAIWLVPGRRRKEVRAIAVGLVLVGVLVLVVRRVAGTYIVEELAPSSALLASEDAWQIITRHLRDAAWTDIMVGLVALAGVWLAGPGRRAQEAMRWLAPRLARREILYGVLAGAWILLLWWRPTVQFARPLSILIGVGLTILGAEALRRIALARHPAAAAAAPTPLPPVDPPAEPPAPAVP